MPRRIIPEEAARWLRGLQRIEFARTLRRAKQIARGARNPVRQKHVDPPWPPEMATEGPVNASSPHGRNAPDGDARG